MIAMKKLVMMLCLISFATPLLAQSTTILLNPPDRDKGYSIMKALSLRSSQATFDTIDIKLQDLSNLLWAANGVNRADISKRTAPSAMNSQDVDVYVATKAGIFLYDAKKHQLDLIASGDHRLLVAGRQQNYAMAPLFCLLVSDISRFKSGTDSVKLQLAAFDSGIVSQNIGLFCAGTNLATHPRTTMDQSKLREIMKLKNTQYLMLNNLVAYKKE